VKAREEQMGWTEVVVEQCRAKAWTMTKAMIGFMVVSNLGRYNWPGWKVRS